MFRLPAVALSTVAIAAGAAPYVPVAGAAIGTAALVASARPTPAAAATTGALTPPPNAAGAAGLDATVRFLQDAQNLDGGWGGRLGGASDPDFTAWVALALAAAGVNPQDQAKPGGVDAFHFLVAHADELSSTTDYERVLLVAIAAGTSPHDFGGLDLVALILSRRLPDGSFTHVAGGTAGGINDTAFAMLPLSMVPDPSLAPILDRAADWLESVQDASGGWSYAPRASLSSDMTAAVIEALRAVGRGGTRAETRGWAYLKDTFHVADGGFGETPADRESNTASTSWTVQAMWAAGIEPAAWASPSTSPLDYLTAMQDPSSGAIRWKVSADLNPVWMTAYAAPAYAGYPLPIPAVPRAVAPRDPVAASPTPTVTPAPSAGVTAGGGGDGAPLFSRPEAGSKGRAAGGVQRVERTDDDAPTTKRHHPSSDRSQRADRPTTSSLGTGRSGVTRDVAHRGTPKHSRSAGLAGKSAVRAAGDSAGGGPSVGGQVIGLPRSGADGTGDRNGAAPGLRSATAQDGSALAGGLAALLLVALSAGMTLERHRVREAA
ncbi:MAG: prenyltransferase/squalene oxidase repeat-containing protein [Solirubrobacteraceae bacterium]